MVSLKSDCTLYMKNDNIFHIINQIKVARVPLKIGSFCMVCHQKFEKYFYRFFKQKFFFHHRIGRYLHPQPNLLNCNQIFLEFFQLELGQKLIFQKKIHNPTVFSIFVGYTVSVRTEKSAKFLISAIFSKKSKSVRVLALW